MVINVRGGSTLFLSRCRREITVETRQGQILYLKSSIFWQNLEYKILAIFGGKSMLSNFEGPWFELLGIYEEMRRVRVMVFVLMFENC